ncbi:MAG TPA: AraC family transcriptional regulator, partial [Alphaproteobacteria bacterium]|nr:AraC family transcriptional regulator [Alphaproteobacteria bacterium]
SIEATAAKLKALIGSKDPGDRLYAESLCVVLQHELFRLACGTVGARRPKGALAPWQEKRVRDYIEENLAGPLSLALLAQLVGLSTFHFARAFKRTFGQPPHRYYSSRRIEGAKALLAARGHSVTDVALALGFSETSAFTSAFRKATGLTPSEYRREHR